MVNQLFKDISQFVAKNGEKIRNDDGTQTYDFSEFTLGADAVNGKVIPKALSFNLFGTDFVYDSSDSFMFIDTTSDEIESFDVDDENFATKIKEYLEWRYEAMREFSL